MPKTLYVGIDVHSKHNSCCFIDESSNHIGSIFTVSNNLPGAQELEAKILTIMREFRFENLKIATESTSFLDLHLVDYLASSKLLEPYTQEFLSV